MTNRAEETIILLHGIGRTRLSFFALMPHLRRAGYKIMGINYPSRSGTVKNCADYLWKYHLNDEFWTTQTRVHFITHSMGGLVVDAYIEKYGSSIPAGKLGRIVMLAPPLGGSEIADFWSRIGLYHFIFGPAGKELTTTARRTQKQAVSYELGVIAGTKSWYYPDAWFLFGRVPNDGRVSVANTRIDRMSDHTILHAGHGSIMNTRTTRHQILTFLTTGRFDHGARKSI